MVGLKKCPYTGTSDSSIASAPLSTFGASFHLNARRQSAFARIDRAPFSWFHARVWIVAGVGFFTTAYGVFAIGIAAIMIGAVYGSDLRPLPPVLDFSLKAAAPLGSVFGQLFFGWLPDVHGRKRMYGFGLIIIVISTFAQAIAGQGPAVNIIMVIVVWRFVLGVGVGVDYPLSAAIASEFAPTRSRGRLMTAVLTAQGWGKFFASLASLIILSSYKKSFIANGSDDLVYMDLSWRLLIGLGCVSGMLALYLRLTIPETPRFTMDVERDVKLAVHNIQAVLSLKGVSPGVWRVDEELSSSRVDAPRPTLRDFLDYFGYWKNLKLLIGTTYSWFALGMAYYGLGLNYSDILTPKFLSAINIGKTVLPSPGLSKFQDAYNLSLFTLLLAGCALIPGYWASFFFIDRWGRKPLQLMGFSVLSVLFLVMGFGYNFLNASDVGSKIFAYTYILVHFFLNFGPNVTTFVYSGELFPTRYRTTAHGIASAGGKLGAIIAQSIFIIPGNSTYLIMRIMGFVMISGIASTLLLPETKGRSLEELSNENQTGFIRSANTFELRNGLVLRKAE